MLGRVHTDRLLPWISVLALLVAQAAGATPRLLSPRLVDEFYQARMLQPAWQGPHCKELRAQLLDAIDHSASHGLEPATYHRDLLASEPGCSEALDPFASDAWLSLARHVRQGRVDPLSVSPHWTLSHEPTDYRALLERALEQRDLMSPLEALAPAEDDYQALRRALAELRSLGEPAQDVLLEPGPLLRQGDQGPRVLALHMRLQALGLLPSASAPGPAQLDLAAELPLTQEEGGFEGPDPPASKADVFDAELDAALRAFQRGVNLEPDGIVGPRSLEELRRGPVQRIEQLRVNLERWRWLPRALGRRHLRVNIADFRLQAWSDGAIEREFAVIVGSEYRPTPSFSADLAYVVLNPDWVVPRKLAVQDKLPLFRRDPGAFDRLGFELYDRAGDPVDAADVDWHGLSRNYFPYRLRQRPGPANALGQVKLILPNPHHVYLHDTPTRGLFARVRRDFSSGCIRVEDALGLTEWVLQETAGWDRSRIDAAVASGERTRVNLTSPLRVHLLYLTALPQSDGSVRYVADLYGHDARVLAALEAAAAR
jgi:L,D-transpeptidase YcbB